MDKNKRHMASCVCITFLLSASVVADQDEFENVCADPALHPQFVESSLYLVQHGTDRNRVLDVLLCITKRKPNNSTIGPAAVRAMFHIAEQNQRIQRYLLEVVQDPTAYELSIHEAFRLLVHVADDSGREQLRSMVRRDFSCNGCSRALRALVECGDAQTLVWLDRQLATLPSNLEPMRPLLETMAKQIRLQQDPSQLIAYLTLDKNDIDRGWVVRQAVRHKVNRDQLHTAAMTYLGRNPAASSRFQKASLVTACDEYGLLTEGDAQACEVIREVRILLDSTTNCGVGSWPKWAALVKAKRAAFYSIPYTVPAVVDTIVPVPTTQPAKAP